MKKDDVYIPKQARLRGIPKDIYDIILEAQKEQKKKCHCQFSIESTIYLLVRKAVNNN